MTPWPHQTFAVAETLGAIDLGQRHICLTSPTGGGKSWMMCEIIKALTSRDWYTVLYTNRRMLIDQLVVVLHSNGIECGVRAAGYESKKSLPVQISSLQTERARQWEPHGEGRKCLVIVDEAHLNAGRAVQDILEWHESRKHVRLGVTATHLDIGHLYDHLIVAGTNSELRDCGALVPAYHYGPDEPDTLTLKKVTLGKDLSEKQQRKAIMTATIWGRVIDGFRKLNPTNRPTILFAPGVGESLWFAEQFQAAGIPAAHIDGENVWRDGNLYRRVRGENDPAADILAASKAGELAVICNRFVLREGIDAPWLSHLIFACILGGLGTYLQAGGRLLRAFPGLEAVTVQDHGGHWWRLGSLNADRHWEIGHTSEIASELRADRLRNKKCQRCQQALNPGFPRCVKCGFLNEVEPVLCPDCQRVLNYFRCPCGWEAPPKWRPARPVVQLDGSLKEMTGDIFQPRRISNRPDAAKQWARLVLYRSRPTAKNPNGMTFRQCEAVFAMENNWCYPSRTLPLMPINEADFFRFVKDVPKDRLRG